MVTRIYDELIGESFWKCEAVGITVRLKFILLRVDIIYYKISSPRVLELRVLRLT